MYEEVFKNIDDVYWIDAGCSIELDYIEQISWILFFYYLDDFEAGKETAAILNGQTLIDVIATEPGTLNTVNIQVKTRTIDRNKSSWLIGLKKLKGF